MDRARRAGWTALIVVVLVASIGGWRATPVLAAAVAWPPSTLVVSEVQTGGTSASDEFVEIANQGATPVDLVGLEVVYATSSGSTVTRKATWATATILAPGQRLLIANAAGVHALHRRRDLYRRVRGDRRRDRAAGRRWRAIDAVGWGDATNAFVEGTAAAAPPAGSSLERRPGGTAGNGDGHERQRRRTGSSRRRRHRRASRRRRCRARTATPTPPPTRDADPERRPRRPTPVADADAVATHADTDGRADRDARPDADADPHADRRPQPDPDADPDADADPVATSRRRHRGRCPIAAARALADGQPCASRAS